MWLIHDWQIVLYMESFYSSENINYRFCDSLHWFDGILKAFTNYFCEKIWSMLETQTMLNDGKSIKMTRQPAKCGCILAVALTSHFGWLHFI